MGICKGHVFHSLSLLLPSTSLLRNPGVDQKRRASGDIENGKHSYKTCIQNIKVHSFLRHQKQQSNELAVDNSFKLNKNEFINCVENYNNKNTEKNF